MQVLGIFGTKNVALQLGEKERWWDASVEIFGKLSTLIQELYSVIYHNLFHSPLHSCFLSFNVWQSRAGPGCSRLIFNNIYPAGCNPAPAPAPAPAVKVPSAADERARRLYLLSSLHCLAQTGRSIFTRAGEMGTISCTATATTTQNTNDHTLNNYNLSYCALFK